MASKKLPKSSSKSAKPKTSSKPSSKPAKPKVPRARISRADAKRRIAAEKHVAGASAAEVGKAIGAKAKRLSQAGHEILKNPVTQAYIEEFRAQMRQHAEVEAQEVYAVFARQMRGSIDELLDDNGNFDYAKAKASGATRLIKKLRIKKREIKDASGRVIGDETNYEIELHDPHKAAASLATMLGLNQEPAPNERSQVRAAVEKYAAMTGCEWADAVRAMAKVNKKVAKYAGELLNG